MRKKIIVNKFGGGILTKNLMPLMAKRLQEQTKKDYKPIVVISALPGVTDEILVFLGGKKFASKTAVNLFVKNLEKKHSQIIGEIGLGKESERKAQTELKKLFSDLEKDLRKLTSTPLSGKSEDKIIAYGEKLSATVFSNYLNSLKLTSKKILAEEIPIITDDNFGNANINFEVSKKNLLKKINPIGKTYGVIPVIPGFTGKTKDGYTTTLGRGGTDTTACFVGSALQAEKIILWKDVGGVLSADPKIVPDAKTIPVVSYQEAEEAGKIIHDKAIQYAKLSGTSVEITSLASPELKTKIEKSKYSGKGAKIVSYKRDLILFLITDEAIKGSELLSLVSEIFLRNAIDVILISNTRYSLQIVAENGSNSVEKAFGELKNKVLKVEIHPVSMVFLVGSFDVHYVNDFNSLLIKLRANLEISAFLYKNCTRLEAVIRTDKIENIIRALHKKFIK